MKLCDWGITTAGNVNSWANVANDYHSDETRLYQARDEETDITG